MDLKRKEFEEQKEEIMKEFECTEDELQQCFRCYKVEHESVMHHRYGEPYCECCYDDMFVSWGSINKR